MEIQVIGTGSSGNCYAVSDGQSRLLLEAGVPLSKVQRALGFGLAGCDGCLISHAHGDHARYVRQVAAKGVDVYASRETIRQCRLDGEPCGVKTLQCEAQAAKLIGSFTVLAFPVQHDIAGALAFLIYSRCTREKLLYFTDTPALPFRFFGLTHLMAECNYDHETLMRAVYEGSTPPEAVKRLAASHMSLENLLKIVENNDLTSLRQVYVIHMSDRHGDPQVIKDALQRATGAQVTIC